MLLPSYPWSHLLLESPWSLLGVPLPLLQSQFEKLLLFNLVRSNAGGLLHHVLRQIWSGDGDGGGELGGGDIPATQLRLRRIGGGKALVGARGVTHPLFDLEFEDE